MINWPILVYPVIIFITFFVIHVILWRIFHPKSHITALILCFIILPAILLGVYLFIGVFHGTLTPDIHGTLYSIFLYCCIAGAYIQTYPAIQAWSPSLFIVYSIQKAGRMLSHAQIEKIISSDRLIHERMKDLLDEGLLESDGNGNVRLTAKGTALALFFIRFRKLLGLSDGRG